MYDISKDFRWNLYDATVGKELIKLEGTPEAIQYFAEICDHLSDYAYWFFLSTLWVSYSGWSDLNLWKKLFSADRPKKKTSIMKPSEVRAYDYLPYFVTAYRAHRIGERDWISYTLNKDIAVRFAHERKAVSINEFLIEKKDVTALFLRRGEDEILFLDKSKALFIRSHEIVDLKVPVIQKKGW